MRSMIVTGVGCLLLAGCSSGPSNLNPTQAPQAASAAGARFAGNVHGGQNPIAGARVYVFAANTTGYGNPSVSLLQSGPAATLDSSGGPTNGDYYVTSDSGGNFNITGDYNCPADGQKSDGQTDHGQIYVYALGGDPGAGPNSSLGLMAVLGSCAAPPAFVTVNEVSTIVAAYAMAGFATDATHVSSSGTALARVGVANAFANAANLANVATATALAATPPGNGTAPQAEINTLANILAMCVNSNGAVSGPTSPTPCYTLFNNTLSGGLSGTVPAETATAAINIAHNPAAKVNVLYPLPPPASPFAPVLAAQPNDFTVGLSFTGVGSGQPGYLAIDGSGNAWVTNFDANIVTKLSPSGAVLSGASGFAAGLLNSPWGIAIDGSGNAWVANEFGGAHGNIIEISNSGGLLSSPSGYTGGGLSFPEFVSMDGLGNAWVTNASSNAVTEFSAAGAILSGPSGYHGSGLTSPYGVAIDGSGSAWITNQSSSPSVTKIASGGNVLSGASGYTGGGLFSPLVSPSTSLATSG